MKPNAQNAAPGQNIPRDSDTADAEASDRRHVPGADDRHALDEDQAVDQRGVTPDSASVEKLHPSPKAGEQLRSGTGGDAARPGKEGVTGKPVPARGDLRT